MANRAGINSAPPSACRGADQPSAGYFDNARTEIAPLLPDTPSSVLEIGCGDGNTLAWLKESMQVPECVGVELNSAAVEVAKAKGLVVHQANVELNPLPLGGRQFDVILCLDVLEHLVDPWRVLPTLLPSLREGGCLIASIPNVCHVSVLSPLIFRNRWTYQEAGVLDRTHMRFFTRKSAVELLSVPGLRVERIVPRIGRKTHRRINVLTLGLLERFLSLQYLIRARKA